MARDYKANGFFFTNLNGYTMNHLIARADRRLRPLRVQHHRRHDAQLRGLLRQRRRASTSGRRRRRPSRCARSSRNVDGWGSPLGFSATNMRYVTITKSRFYNNARRHRPERAGLGEVPAGRGQRDHRQRHLLEQLQLPRRAAAVQGPRGPAPPRSSPVGTGILLLGGRGNRVENNRIYGNYLAGVAAIEGILLEKNPEARDARRATSIRNNAVRARRHRPQRPRHRLRRQRQRQLLLASPA